MKEFKRSESEKQDNVTKRVLRRRKKRSYHECIICKTRSRLQRSYRKKLPSSNPSIARKKNETSLMKIQRRSRPNSASSSESVVFLGRHRKIPQLIVLDDSSDDEKQLDRVTPRRKKFRKLRNTKLSSFDARQEKRSKASQTIYAYETTFCIQLQEMHVSSAMTDDVFN